MKYIFKIAIIIFISSILLVSCKKTVTESEEETLFGTWSFSSMEATNTITTNSNQTAKLPFTGIGTIKLQATTATHLNALFIENYDPLTIGAVRIEYENYVSTIITIDDDTKIATAYSGFTDKTFTGAVEYSFDGNELIITESTLTNVDDANDTIVVSGSIAFENLSITADTPTTIDVPKFQTMLPRRYMEVDFSEDGTFTQTINNTDGSSVTNLGTWESSGDEITTTITTDGTYIDIFEYSVNGNILELKQESDACSGAGDYLLCLNYYEGLYQLDFQSITEVRTENTIDFRRVSEL